jgi:preprotein translocase subunit SecG
LEPNLKKDPGASVFDASILMDYDDLDESDGLVNGVGRGGVGVGENPNQKTTTLGLTKPPNNLDATTRGGLSTTYNAQIADDSLSTLSDKKKRVIVRIVTIFSVIFFLICFAMIAFTLRMSEKIDAQS